mmetsp:Transcript_20796/g.54136  ORF Transcript_20796/g.54136 Transcript_20796/m.54136 type:complete len:213 (-) Transcript_20796:107-745(-)
MRQLALQPITARDVAARDPRVDILPCALHGLGRNRSNRRGCCGRSRKWERCCCASAPRNRRRRGLGGRWRRDRRCGCRRGGGGRRLGSRPPAEEEPAPTTLWPLTNLRLQAQTARHLRARGPRVQFDRSATASLTTVAAGSAGGGAAVLREEGGLEIPPLLLPLDEDVVGRRANTQLSIQLQARAVVRTGIALARGQCISSETTRRARQEAA